jgi:hypothetical protein
VPASNVRGYDRAVTPFADPARRALVVRAFRDAMSIAGVLLLLITIRNGGAGFDFYAYWSVDPANPYAVAEGFGAFHYTPPLVWLAGPLRLVPWPAAYWIWFGLLLVVLVWLARDWALAWLAFPPVASELFHGNIHLLIAAALVLSIRMPAAYSFLALSKVSPGIVAIWWLVRREWRQLAVALGVAGVVAALSVAAAPDLWLQWLRHVATQSPEAANLVPLPVLVRLPFAALVVLVAARTNRAWLLAPAVVLALPLLWVHGLAVLVAITPLARLRETTAAEPALGRRSGFGTFSTRPLPRARDAGS